METAEDSRDYVRDALEQAQLHSLIQQTPNGWTSAVLLTILMIATLQFARSFQKSLLETYRLQLKERRTAEKLRQSLEAKSQFMIDANHDLRQPLQALELSLYNGSSDAATRETSSRTTAKLALDSMKDYLDRLQQYSEAETQPAPALASMPISTLLAKLHVLLEPLAQARSIDLRCVPSSLWVRSDPAGLETILRNLLENAIRHAGRDSTVLFGCRRREGQVIVHVIDNGAGIASEDQARIFQEFVQLGNPERRRDKGIGLGLPIAQRMARRIGAVLELRSTPGQGANFALSLPCAPPSDEPLSERRPTTAPKGSKAQVLIVDGEEMIRSGFATLLSDWGQHALVAASCEQALKVIENGAVPDVLIIDYRLEVDRNGFDARDEIVRRVGHAIPTIIITGDTNEAIETRAEQEGCYFLLKPVEIDKVQRLIVTVCAARA